MKRAVLIVSLIIMSSKLVSYNTLHLEKVQAMAASNSYINASRCDFRGADMAGIQLANSQLSGANFGTPKKNAKTAGIISIPGQKTDLSGANLSNAKLVSAELGGANLQKANLSGANVLNANFTGADLTGANIDGMIHGQYAVFCGATMPDGTKFSQKTWKSKSGQLLYSHCPKKK